VPRNVQPINPVNLPELLVLLRQRPPTPQQKGAFVAAGALETPYKVKPPREGRRRPKDLKLSDLTASACQCASHPPINCIVDLDSFSLSSMGSSGLSWAAIATAGVVAAFAYFIVRLVQERRFYKGKVCCGRSVYLQLSWPR
jgi:hypothetical protein